MAEQMRFDGEVAVISGAGRGLGREYALLLAARGAKVVVNNRRGSVPGEDPAADVVAAIRAAGGEAVVNHSDVAQPEAGASIIGTALEAYGRIDIVVANAGVMAYGESFEQTTLDSLERMLRIHVAGTYTLLRAAWPHLRAQDYGRVVTTASAAGFYGQPGSIEYSAAKGAIIGLTRALAHESAGTGIRVNLISPAGMTGPNERLNVDETTKAVLRQWLNPALVAPVVARLAHRSCPFNGRLFSAGGGHVGRVSIGEAPGVWPSESSVEAYAALDAVVDGTDGLVFHEDAITWGAWMAQEAAQHAQR